jgi:hypothetical protein
MFHSFIISTYSLQSIIESCTLYNPRDCLHALSHPSGFYQICLCSVDHHGSSQHVATLFCVLFQHLLLFSCVLAFSLLILGLICDQTSFSDSSPAHRKCHCRKAITPLTMTPLELTIKKQKWDMVIVRFDQHFAISKSILVRLNRPIDPTL